MENHAYTLVEVFAGIIGVTLAAAFAGWGAIVKRSADQMADQIERAIDELSKLREEIHRDRVLNERRFARLEQHTGIMDHQ